MAHTLPAVLEYIKTHVAVKYQAPMDTAPHTVRIIRYTIDNKTPEKSKMTVWTPATKTLTWTIVEHLERFII